MPQFQRGPATTKSLNTGVTGTTPATGDATGFTVYASLANAPSVLYRQSGVIPFDTSVSLSSINTSLGTAPTTNTSTIVPPTSPFVINNVNNLGTLAAGTYYLAYTYDTARGQTTISPVLPVTVPGPTGEIVLNGIADPHATSLTLELSVPRLEDWHVTRYAIYVSSSVSTPTCNVYIDTMAITSLLDTTPLGAQNSANADIYLRPGQKMIVQWLGADLAASATLSVYGEKTS